MPSFQWSYLVMVLCFSMTSSAFLNYHGNGFNRYGNEPSDVKRDEIQTPPTDYRISDRNTNDSICKELCRKGDGGNACLCDWPPLKKEALFSLKQLFKEKPFSLIQFPTPEDEPVCKLLCQYGENDHFCLCN